ncbi:DNA repair protein RecO [Methylosoma difficile]
MTETVYLQPSYILQKRPYRETSLILDVLTRDYGRLSLIARGVHKAKSKTSGLLQPFVPLNVSFLGNGELKVLTTVEAHPVDNSLTGMAFYCGFYLNELLVYFLHNNDPHAKVFAAYHECLQKLAREEVFDGVLRIFELQLLEAVGYGLPLQYDQHGQLVLPCKNYFFDPERGAVLHEQGAFSGATLLAMHHQQLQGARQLAEAKALMRHLIDFHLQGRELKSRAVANQIFKQLNV